MSGDLDEDMDDFLDTIEQNEATEETNPVADVSDANEKNYNSAAATDAEEKDEQDEEIPTTSVGHQKSETMVELESTAVDVVSESKMDTDTETTKVTTTATETETETETDAKAEEEPAPERQYGFGPMQEKLSTMSEEERQAFFASALKKLCNFDIKAIDKNNNGEIELDELEVYCEEVNIDIPFVVVVNLFYDIDADHSGHISPIEYFKWRIRSSVAIVEELCTRKPPKRSELERKVVVVEVLQAQESSSESDDLFKDIFDMIEEVDAEEEEEDDIFDTTAQIAQLEAERHRKMESRRALLQADKEEYQRKLDETLAVERAKMAAELKRQQLELEAERTDLELAKAKQRKLEVMSQINREFVSKKLRLDGEMKSGDYDDVDLDQRSDDDDDGDGYDDDEPAEISYTSSSSADEASDTPDIYFEDMDEQIANKNACCACFRSDILIDQTPLSIQTDKKELAKLIRSIVKTRVRLTKYILRFGDSFVDDGTMIISVSRLQRVCKDVHFEDETGIYLWTMIMDKLAQKSYDCLWLLLRFLGSHLPTPIAVELIKQYVNELSRYPPSNVVGITARIVDSSTFPVATALVCAAYFKKRAAADLSNARTLNDYVEQYSTWAAQMLNHIESDYLATMMLQMKSFHDGLTPFQIAVRNELIEFLSSDRLGRIGHAMWVKRDLLKPEISDDSFEVHNVGYTQVVRKLTTPYEFYFTPFGFNFVESFLFIIYLIAFSVLCLKGQNVYDPIRWYDYVFWVANLGYVFNELVQFFEYGPVRYFQSLENLIDICVSLGWITVIFFRLIATLLNFLVNKSNESGGFQINIDLENPDSPFNLLFQLIFVSNAVLLWSKCLNFLMLSNTEGPLLNAFRTMTTDIWNFLRIFVVISGGFMFCMYFLVGDTNPLFVTIYRSAVVTFLAAIGQPDWVQVTGGDNVILDTINSWVIIIYSIIGFVLLFNLLIAMMAESYESMSGQAAKQVLLNKTSLAFDLDGSAKIMPPPFNFLLLILFLIYSVFDLLTLAFTAEFLNEQGWQRYWRCKNSKCKFLNPASVIDADKRQAGNNIYLCSLCDKKHTFQEISKLSKRRLRRKARGLEGDKKKNCCVRIGRGVVEIFNPKVKWKHHSWGCGFCRQRIPKNYPASLNRYFGILSETHNLDNKDVNWIVSQAPALCPYCYRPRSPRARPSYILENISYLIFLLLVLPLMWFILWPFHVYDKLYRREKENEDHRLFEKYHNRTYGLRPKAVKTSMPRSHLHQSLLSLHHPIWRQLHGHRSLQKNVSLEASLHASNMRQERVRAAAAAEKREEVTQISHLVMDVVGDMATNRIRWEPTTNEFLSRWSTLSGRELETDWLGKRQTMRSEAKEKNRQFLINETGGALKASDVKHVSRVSLLMSGTSGFGLDSLLGEGDTGTPTLMNPSTSNRRKGQASPKKRTSSNFARF